MVSQFPPAVWLNEQTLHNFRCLSEHDMKNLTIDDCDTKGEVIALKEDAEDIIEQAEMLREIAAGEIEIREREDAQ